MKIILTRHGRTVENDAGILQGHLPWTLNETGRYQAQRLAERLRNEPIDRAYSSDLARAADTAGEIMRFHPNVPLVLTRELREIHIGEWQGKTKAELGLDGKPGVEAVGPKEGETTQALLARAKSFIADIMAKHPDETVLLVGHSSLNRRIVTALTGQTDVPPPRNASVSVFNVGLDGTAKAELLDCLRHLE